MFFSEYLKGFFSLTSVVIIGLHFTPGVTTEGRNNQTWLDKKRRAIKKAQQHCRQPSLFMDVFTANLLIRQLVSV